MRQFLRQARFSDAYSLLRLLSLAAAGSGALYLNRDADAKTTASVVTATAPLRYLLLLERPIAKDSMIPCRSVVDPDWSSYVAKVLPAIVLISVPKKMDNKSCTSIGSGTIVDADGTILTCAHLVVDFQGRKVVSEDKVDVTLQDGQTFVGTVLNADLHSDIAIVKINSKTPFPAAKLGSSCKLHPGESVVALGNPHFLRNTITAGIVSCVDRKSSEIGLGGMLREYIQIDCAVNPGNSGGPLINLDGEIVGVNIMGRKSAAGLNFAVPSDTVSKIVEQFKKNGRVLRPWLGLKMLDLNKMIIVQLKRRHATFPSIKKGVLVLMVSPGSPADRAGMRPGDIVIEFHGKPVGSITEIVELMDDKVGIPLKVVVKREKGTSVTLTVIPEEVNPEL
ncbi:putative protease Do-like 14 isoform X4 [Diospyros lotus]|uniref:putative protease Do-like 14 isoform X4 n=1 Tax=Diospyros lotus TaxID=55363 RepID=UPI00224E5D63|nr:putative protease Do-like 14 isoform X4 [Diospyros lotus]